MRYIILYIIHLILLSSCLNSKKTGSVWIKPNQEIYERKLSVDSGNGPQNFVYKISIIERIKGNVTLPVSRNDYLKIIFTENIENKIITSPGVVTNNGPSCNCNFFPDYADVPSGVKINEIYSSPKFKYTDSRQVIQTLSIPLKIRPSIRDTVKSSASAGVNLGFAYVFKFTRQTYNRFYWNDNKTASELSDQNSKMTYAFGPFIGPVIIDLKSSNTDAKVIKDRSIVGLTYGGIFVIGYNELNIGFSVGFDQALGGEGKNWIYQRRPWIGFVVALDIIK